MNKKPRAPLTRQEEIIWAWWTVTRVGYEFDEQAHQILDRLVSEVTTGCGLPRSVVELLRDLRDFVGTDRDNPQVDPFLKRIDQAIKPR